MKWLLLSLLLLCLLLLLLLLAVDANGANDQLHSSDADDMQLNAVHRANSAVHERRCFADYARHLRATHDSRLAAIAFDLLPTLLNVSSSLDRLRSKPIVIGVGQGTTATHGFVRLLAESKHYNMTLQHWDSCCASDGRCCPFSAIVKGVEVCAPSCLARHDELGVVSRELFGGFKALRPDQAAVEPADWIEATRAPLEDVRLIEALAAFDVLSDAPVPQYVYYLYKLFPRALIVYTDRAPLRWASRRIERHPNTPVSALFAHRHPDYVVSEFTEALNAAMFVAMRHFVKCLVPAERLLAVDFFEQTPRDIATALKAFVGRAWPQVAAAPELTDKELEHASSTRKRRHRKVPAPEARSKQKSQPSELH
jgi:hypothetical protein